MLNNLTDLQKLIKVNEVCNRIQKRICAEVKAGVYRLELLDLMDRANRLYFKVYARLSSATNETGKE